MPSGKQTWILKTTMFNRKIIYHDGKYSIHESSICVCVCQSCQDLTGPKMTNTSDMGTCHFAKNFVASWVACLNAWVHKTLNSHNSMEMLAISATMMAYLSESCEEKTGDTPHKIQANPSGNSLQMCCGFLTLKHHQWLKKHINTYHVFQALLLVQSQDTRRCPTGSKPGR